MKTTSPIIFNLFYNGTGFKADTLLCGQLHAELHPTQKQHSQTFDGPGVTNGLIRGKIFGCGVATINKPIYKKIQSALSKGNDVIVNAYGHSRGALSAMDLAKRFKSHDPKKIIFNLFLHDPVPGNTMAAAQHDYFGWSLTNQYIDMSQCKTLKQVQVIYATNPLLNYAVHAPMIPKYPTGCLIQEDALLGMHSILHLADRLAEETVIGLSQTILKLHVKQFFEASGSRFNDNPQLNLNRSLTLLEKYDQLFELQKRSFARITPTSRRAHSPDHRRINVTYYNAKFLNTAHKALAIKLQKKHINEKSKVAIRISAANMRPTPETMNYSCCFFDLSAKTFLQKIGFIIGSLSCSLIAGIAMYMMLPLVASKNTLFYVYAFYPLIVYSSIRLGGIAGETLIFRWQPSTNLRM